MTRRTGFRIDPKKLRRFARKFHLDLIVLFGSQAAGMVHGGSDVDIAVRTRVPRSKRDHKWFIRLRNDVDELLGDEGNDVVLLNDADPLLLYEVARNGRPLYQATVTTFVEFQSYAARRFGDNAKFFRMEQEFVTAV